MHQGAVSGVGSDPGDAFAALGIKLPNQLGLGFECFRGGNIFHPVTAPQSIGVAKSRNSALGANAGAGEHKYAVLWGKRFRHDRLVERGNAGRPILLEYIRAGGFYILIRFGGHRF